MLDHLKFFCATLQTPHPITLVMPKTWHLVRHCENLLLEFESQADLQYAIAIFRVQLGSSSVNAT